MQNFFKKIVKKGELQRIFELDNSVDNIRLGRITEVDPKQLIACLNLWTRRIDLIIQMDKDCNKGKPSWISHKANYWRCFTYSEFSALFNSHVTPDQFPFYPVFSQIHKRKIGGIKTEKQRTDFILQLTYDEETYSEILHKHFPTLLQFFFDFSELNSLLPLKALKAHTHIVAPSGYGKSELMRVIFYRMQKKYPKFTLILIDPHGSLARDVKKSKLNKDSDNLIYINPTWKEGYTPTFNVFDLGDKLSSQNLTQTCEQIFTAFEEILSKEAGKKLSEVMTNALEKCIYFILQKSNTSILDLMALLNAEERICKEAYEYDSFFNDQWKKHGNKTRESLFNRIGRLLNSPILKNFLSGKSTFNLEKCINYGGKVIILDIGDAGELTQELIGKLFVASVKSIIRKRQKNTGIPTFMFIDEVHVLMSGSFEYILSQLRGYGLHLVLAHQYISQLSTKNGDAVRQNTAIKIGGGDDFEDIGKMIKKLPKNANLKLYEWFLKVRHKELTKFNAPANIVKNPKKYNLSEAEEKELDKKLLQKFYKVTGEEERPERQYPELEEEEPTKPLMPPFDLLIPNDGETTK